MLLTCFVSEFLLIDSATTFDTGLVQVSASQELKVHFIDFYLPSSNQIYSHGFPQK